MGERYRVELPPEPDFGTVMEGVNTGLKYQRLRTGPEPWQKSGWYRLTEDGTPDFSASTGWKFLLEVEGELEDVTPLQTWTMPIIPPLGTYVITHDFEALADNVGQIWRVRQDSDESPAYMWTPAIMMSWPEFLGKYGVCQEWRQTSPRDDDLDAWRIKLP